MNENIVIILLYLHQRKMHSSQIKSKEKQLDLQSIVWTIGFDFYCCVDSFFQINRSQIGIRNFVWYLKYLDLKCNVKT